MQHILRNKWAIRFPPGRLATATCVCHTCVLLIYIPCSSALSVFAGKVKRADMMIELETFRARAKSMLDWEFDIIKETANVVDLKLRAAQPSRVVLCGLSAALLNGAVGRVVAPANSAGRVSVKLVSPAAACSRYPNGVFVMPDKMRSEPLMPQFPAISFVLHSKGEEHKGCFRTIRHFSMPSCNGCCCKNRCRSWRCDSAISCRRRRHREHCGTHHGLPRGLVQAIGFSCCYKTPPHQVLDPCTTICNTWL